VRLSTSDIEKIYQQKRDEILLGDAKEHLLLAFLDYLWENNVRERDMKCDIFDYVYEPLNMSANEFANVFSETAALRFLGHDNSGNEQDAYEDITNDLINSIFKYNDRMRKVFGYKEVKIRGILIRHGAELLTAYDEVACRPQLLGARSSASIWDEAIYQVLDAHKIG
jgi:hypothetical protein